MGFQRLTVAIDHFGHQGDALARRHVGQTDQPRMGRLAHVDEFREVAIERHQDAVLGRRTLEQRPVARIVAELAGIDDVMPLAAQPPCQSLPGTPVNEKPQDSATDTADKLSLAITACAYAVQARISSGSSSG